MKTLISSMHFSCYHEVIMLVLEHTFLPIPLGTILSTLEKHPSKPMAADLISQQPIRFQLIKHHLNEKPTDSGRTQAASKQELPDYPFPS